MEKIKIPPHKIEYSDSWIDNHVQLNEHKKSYLRHSEEDISVLIKEKVVNEMQEVKKMIDTLVNNGQQALQALESFTQEEIDNIVHEMALAGVD